jgi:hypothetical protein
MLEPERDENIVGCDEPEGPSPDGPEPALKYLSITGL